MSKKLSFVSLGCDKNTVDSEIMLDLLTEHGYEITKDDNEADAIIVNTCAFIQAAQEESINTIIEMGGYKKTGKCKALIVSWISIKLAGLLNNAVHPFVMALVFGDQFALKPGDLVYVDATSLARWNRVMKMLLPTAQLIYYGTQAVHTTHTAKEDITNW